MLRMLINKSLRDRTYWAVTHGMGRAMMKLAVRSDDPATLALLDINQVDNVDQLVEEVRAKGPISALKGLGWATADAQMIGRILRDPRFVTIKPNDRIPLAVLRWVASVTRPNVFNPLEPPSMLVTDPPRHTHLRALVSKAFTPRAIAHLQSRIQEIANQHLETLNSKTPVDLISAYTTPIPIAVIADMLGLPSDEIPQFAAAAEDSSALVSAFALPWLEYQRAMGAMHVFDDYFDMHIERLRAAPPDDGILSNIVHNGGLSDYEVKVTAAQLMGAGFVTTTHLLGNAIVELIQHPEQRSLLIADPQLWPNAVEEIIRLDTPTPWTVRVAAEDLLLEGCSISAGDLVMLALSGANRDPSRFDRPDTFDIMRTNARDNLSFGTGIHVCLGMALARMEVHISLQSLFERYPDLKLAGTPIRSQSLLARGYSHLPVSLGAPHA